ncbi:hypothetical protein LLG95_13465 [bacterium]|nr:hypothetical protein [bacterium]
MRSNRSVFGFNLLEVALICGFIVLFAMAAMPRFSDAQVRSDVARVNRDLRKLAAAMESYRVDTGSYPCGVVSGSGLMSACNPALLTSPVAYLNRYPTDIFRTMGDSRLAVTYRIYGVAYTPWQKPPGYYRSYNLFPRTSWMTWSYGPDLLTNTGGYFPLPAVIANEASPAPLVGKDRNGNWIAGSSYYGLRYDPTNGTISYGDIFYFGGESRWRLN